MNATLYASSGSLEGITLLIAEFYYGSTISLTQVSQRPMVWSISTGKGECNGKRVIKKGSRYKFESTN